MEAPLLPDSSKLHKSGRCADDLVLDCEEVVTPSRPSSVHHSSSNTLMPPLRVFFHRGVEVTILDEDTYLRLLPYVLTWISIPLIVTAIVLFRPVTTYFIAILFLPSIVSTSIFFILLRPNLNKANESIKIILLCMMIFSCAQALCDGFLSLYVFVDGEYGRDDEILNRDVFVGASVILCMAHVLISLSLFAKFSILLWTTRM